MDGVIRLELALGAAVRQAGRGKVILEHKEERVKKQHEGKYFPKDVPENDHRSS